MAQRKPLVRFERTERAQIVDTPTSNPLTEKKHLSKGLAKHTNTSFRVINGKLNIKLKGYSGVQQIPTAALIPFISLDKLRQAATSVLVASGTRKRKQRPTGKNG